MKPYLILFAAAFIILFSFHSHAYADLELTAGNSATTTPNVATAITGFQIVGPATSTTPVKLRATNGTLNLSSVSGVTMSGNGSNTVNLSGTVENLNAALATLTYTRASIGTDTLEVSLVEAGEVFFEDNGHLYEYISDSGTWTEAKTKAEALSRYGAAGYLVTVTSDAENEFVTARLANAGWMGASDIAVEGEWRWVTGPESGTQFWSGAASGGAFGGNYANWNTGEPNNSGSNEDCGQYLAGGTGRWNDLPCSGNTLPGYVAEFGAPDALPTVVAQNISIVTADVPAITSLSPANGSTLVSSGTDLVIGFSKSVTKQTGEILIKNYADDTTLATIDVSGDEVAGGGTNTITISPSTDLGEGAQYYVIIPDTAFEDSLGNSFEGISLKTTWSFATSDETAPVISALATSVGTTDATITWNTNEPASSRIMYGLTSAHGSTTAESNASPRVSSHSVSLTELMPCTTYYVASVSRDASGNTATSNNGIFTTTGCASGATPTTTTSANVTTNTGGGVELAENEKTFSVQFPADATDVSSSFVIQVKAIPSLPVLSSLGLPDSSLLEVGATLFDVTAIVDGDIILDSFDAEVTIAYEYVDDEVVGLDESSLWLYHYTGGRWEALSDCALDIEVNSISCTTPSFSVFGLFGSEKEGQTTPSQFWKGIYHGCKDPNASNYEFFSSHKQGLCEYTHVRQSIESIMLQYRTLLLGVHNSGITLPQNILDILNISTPALSVRDLSYGMEGEDVKKLQTLLIARGHDIPSGATGSFYHQTQTALAAYQLAHNVSPSVGYFGSITRAQMKSDALEGLWW